MPSPNHPSCLSTFKVFFDVLSNLVFSGVSSKELARQTRTHRLDIGYDTQVGRFEIENGTIQAEHLLEIMRDIGDQLHEKEGAIRPSDITE